MERLNLSLEMIIHEHELLQLSQTIMSNVSETAKKNERTFILREQLKVINEELGGNNDPKQKYMTKVKEQLEIMKQNHANPPAIAVVEEELNRMAYTEIQSSEYSVIRNYIDWITCLPWNQQGKDRMNLQEAETILNEDHFGLKDVKDRILEFIAVGRLQGHVPGKVLCFVGPPGTGKTSIAKSIARALGREYYQFSVGGANDVSQIKGHRRTYVGSMPGKLVHCLKQTKVNNPLILIDEVDKIRSSPNVGVSFTHSLLSYNFIHSFPSPSQFHSLIPFSLTISFIHSLLSHNSIHSFPSPSQFHSFIPFSLTISFIHSLGRPSQRLTRSIGP